MKIVILGGGGHASDILGLVEDINRLAMDFVDVVAVADDEWSAKSRFEGRNVELVLGIDNANKFADFFISAIGYPEGRVQVVQRAMVAGLIPCAPLIHPLANINPRVAVGLGTAILGIASVSGGAEIGEHCYISHGALIGHDTKVGDYSSVMPGASISGDVTVGSAVVVGSGAVVLENLSLGDGSVIGAGAVVVKNVAEGDTVTGVPARSK